MMDWRECLSRRLVKRKGLDRDMVRSLVRESEKKLQTNDVIPMNETTASTKLCIVYDSLREVLEAMAIGKGYKIYNHECYVGFLDEILSLKESSVDFDKFRKVRNSVNYYARQIDVEDAEVLISGMVSLRGKLLGVLDEMGF